MGAFGPPDSFFAKILNKILFMFGPATDGSIYSFGYTLIVGVICNFVFGVTASRLMLAGISKFKKLRNPKLYGGVDNG
jgi:preprotein translocase subunit SecD